MSKKIQDCPLLCKCPLLRNPREHLIGDVYKLDTVEYMLCETEYIKNSSYRVSLICLGNGRSWNNGIIVDTCCKDVTPEEFMRITGEFYYRFVLIRPYAE